MCAHDPVFRLHQLGTLHVAEVGASVVFSPYTVEHLLIVVIDDMNGDSCVIAVGVRVVPKSTQAAMSKDQLVTAVNCAGEGNLMQPHRFGQDFFPGQYILRQVNYPIVGRSYLVGIVVNKFGVN
jgi:hypothetical protein